MPSVMSEHDLEAGVLDIARLYGWRVVHFRPARTAHGWRTPVAADGMGWPDLFCVRAGRMVAAELKSERGHLTRYQADWLAALAAAGAESHVWRPCDYPDRIAEILR